jgi:hypothetical protein
VQLKKLLICIAIPALTMLTPAFAGATSINGGQDCDTNAVVSCGISDSSQLTQAAAPRGIACLYDHFGITSDDVNNFDSQAVAGRVTRSGNVVVGGKLVAKDAMTAGRQNMPGSSRFTCANHSFFIRPPSASFSSASLPAFVVMRDGQFAFAVIASCGNPVMATAITPKVSVPVKQPPVRPAQTQTQSQSQSVTITAPPAVQSATTPAPQPVAAKILPNTGPGNILALAGVTSGLGTVGHWYYSRRSRRY